MTILCRYQEATKFQHMYFTFLMSLGIVFLIINMPVAADSVDDRGQIGQKNITSPTQANLNILMKEHEDWCTDPDVLRVIRFTFKDRPKEINHKFNKIMLDKRRFRIEPSRDFSETDLKSRSLPYAEFSGANFTKANFSGARLEGSRFRGTNLIKADFYCSILIFSDLSNARLNSATFENADIHSANFSSTDLNQAIMNGVNGYNAIFSRANIMQAQLKLANLSYAHLDNTFLDSSDLSGANLTYADLTAARLTNTKLENADLYRANLTNVLYEPREKTPPIGIAYAIGLSTIQVSTNLQFLANLKNSLKDTGFDQAAREVIAALRRNEIHINSYNYGIVDQNTIHDRIKYWLFDYPIAYGSDRFQPVIILGKIWFWGMIFFWIMMIIRPNGIVINYICEGKTINCKTIYFMDNPRIKLKDYLNIPKDFIYLKTYNLILYAAILSFLNMSQLGLFNLTRSGIPYLFPFRFEINGISLHLIKVIQVFLSAYLIALFLSCLLTNPFNY